jgi:hypothetical protein
MLESVSQTRSLGKLNFEAAFLSSRPRIQCSPQPSTIIRCYAQP